MNPNKKYTGGVQDTSIQAYWAEKLGYRIGKQAALVLDNLNIYGPGTRAALATRCDLKINVICGRVNELLQAGCIETDGTELDVNTNKQVQVLRVKGDEANVQ